MPTKLSLTRPSSAFALLALTLFASACSSGPSASSDVSIILSHFKTSKDFTLKVADQMPEADYDFKLTPPQMSFAQQMVHLSQGFDEFLAPFSGDKFNSGKPASMCKADVLDFVKKSFDSAIDRVSKLTPEQVSKSYTGEGGSQTGLDLLLGMLDHTTHHRASAEMYLRAKGITPTPYQF